MNRFRIITIRAVLFAVTFGMSMQDAAAQDAPGLLHYQGRLTNPAGEPITTPVWVTFSFFDDPTSGTWLSGFSDSDQVLPNQDGLYATLIGDDLDSLVPDSIFTTDGDVYLNVKIDGESLLPRKRIVSVAYAMRSTSATSADSATTATHATTADTATIATAASDADTLDGNDSTAFAGAGHGHSLQDLGGAVTDGQVADDITINHAATADSAASARSHDHRWAL